MYLGEGGVTWARACLARAVGAQRDTRHARAHAQEHAVQCILASAAITQSGLQWEVLHEAASIRKDVVDLEPGTYTFVGTPDAHPFISVHLAVILWHRLLTSQSQRAANSAPKPTPGPHMCKHV